MRSFLAAGLTLVVAACGDEAAKEMARKPTPATTSPGAIRAAPPPGTPAALAPRPGTRPLIASVRITMEALHANGGVPPGWRFSAIPGNPQAGRKVFADFGCGSCHAIRGEPFEPTGLGPDLTGMGGHHPAEYFVESIVTPDAVIVDGQGYTGPDTRSIMPSYPDMTLAQLGDVVAYLISLRGPEPGSGAMMAQPAALAPRPAPPPATAQLFFVQTYDVKPGLLQQFEEWFRAEGAAQFLAYPGLVSVETYVDGTRAERSVVTMWGFRDEESLNRFQVDPKVEGLGNQFDAFIGPHDHLVFRTPAVYKAPTLSAP